MAYQQFVESRYQKASISKGFAPYDRKAATLEAHQISVMMNSSSGRDKVCALLQYIIELYSISLQNKGVSGNSLKIITVCNRIVRSISSSRKMLRFMKFIEGIKRSYKYLNETLYHQVEQLEETARIDGKFLF